MTPERLCLCGCGRPVERRRSTKKYALDECRQRAYRRRRELHKSFELVNIRKKIAGDLMRAGIIPEGGDSASIYEYTPQRRPQDRGRAAKARTRREPETLEAYQQRTKGKADLWRFRSGVFDSETVSPNRQRIPGVNARRGYGESTPPRGVKQNQTISFREKSLTVTHTISKGTIPVNTTPTIAERLTRLETSVALGLELTRRIAEQLGLPPDDARVQEAVEDFLDSLD